MRTRLSAAVVSAVAVLGGLSGCGSDISPDMHPGQAAVVGDEGVTLDEVDDLTDSICRGNEEALKSSGLVLPMAYLRSVSLDTLVQHQLLRQFAEGEGVDVGNSLELAKAQARPQSLEEDGSLDADALKFYTFIEFAKVVAGAVGAEEAGAGAPAEAAQQAGLEQFEQWRGDVEVDIDPRFGTIDNQTGEFTAPGGLLSFGVSKSLPDAASVEEFDKAYVDALPSDQRCG